MDNIPGSTQANSAPASQPDQPAQSIPQPALTIQADNGTFNTGKPANPGATDPGTSGPAQAELTYPASKPDGMPDAKFPQDTAASTGAANPANAEANAASDPAQPGDPAQGSQTDPANAPITDWTKSGINTDGIKFEQDVWDSFGAKAVELGLTPKQAEGLARWQLAQIMEQQAIRNEQSFNELKNEWGANAGALQTKCVNLVSRIDKALGEGSRFRAALDATGASGNADIIRGLLVMANALSEDSGTTPAQTFIKPKVEDALSGLQAAFAQARSRRQY